MLSSMCVGQAISVLYNEYSRIYEHKSAVLICMAHDQGQRYITLNFTPYLPSYCHHYSCISDTQRYYGQSQEEDDGTNLAKIALAFCLARVRLR